MPGQISHPRVFRRAGGNALIPAILTMTVLLLIGLNTVQTVCTRYRTTFHSAAWEDALRAAESGVDIAATQLNSDSATATWAGFTGSSALSGWTPPPYTDMIGNPPPPGTYNYRKAYFNATSPYPLPSHGGEGNNTLCAVVRIDPIDSTGAMYSQADYNSHAQVWYRLRSTGVATVPGSPATTYETSLATTTGQRDHLSLLRRLVFITDKTNGALPLPQVTRTVEVILQPTGANLFARTVTVQGALTMSGGSYTDSYDSTDPTKSTGSYLGSAYAGLYDPSKRQSNGDIATDSAGGLSNLTSSYILGSAYSNTGNFLNDSNVEGSEYTNFDTALPPVSDPTLTNIISSPSVITNTNVTLNAGTYSSPSNYKLSQFVIGTNKVVTLANPTPGAPAYINVWVTGGMSITGTASVVVQSGVHATFYLDGNATVAGSGVTNMDGVPAELVFYGVTPSSGPSPTFTRTGAAAFQGVVYAPGFVYTDAATGDFSGAIVAGSASLTGGAGFHYDQSLSSNSSGKSTFQMISWIEDIEQLAPQP